MRSTVGQTRVPATRPRARWGLVGPLGVLLVVTLCLAGYFVYGRFLKPQPVAVALTEPVTVARGSIAATVSTTGSVVPARTADLAFTASGRLAELSVAVGKSVKKGDVLARLEASDLELQLVQAKAQLTSAEAKLAALQAGSTAADIAQARAQTKSAQIKLSQLNAGPTAAQLQSAKASATSARGQLAKAETDLAKLKAGLTEDEKISAQIAIEKSKIALHNSQVAYDKIAWRPDASATAEAMNLWQATVDNQAAEISYKTAMAGPSALDLTLAEGTVESARAQLTNAESSLATLQAGPAEDEVAAAEAAALQAESTLALKLSPPAEADVQSARATIEQARAGVQTAQKNLDNATMLAPFDGVVATANGSVGATISGTVVTLLDLSAPQVQVTMAETDVAKVAVGQEAVLTFEALGGQQLPGRILTISPKATVQSGVATYTAFISIENQQTRAPAAQGAQGLQHQGGAPSSEQGQGAQSATPAAGMPADQRQGARSATASAGSSAEPTPDARSASAVTGRAAAAPADLSKIRPGMTASASIVYLRRDNVLVVPNRALRAQGRDRVVDVLLDGVAQARVVTVGAADQQYTEIVAGLKEGEQVAIPATATTTAPSSVPGLQGGQFAPKPGGR